MIVRLLESVLDASSPSERSSHVASLLALTRSPGFSASPLPPELYKVLVEVVAAALAWRGKEVLADVIAVESVALAFLCAPGFDSARAEAHVGDALLLSLESRLDGTASPDEFQFFRDLLLWLYRSFAHLRAALRALMAGVLVRAASRPLKSSPVAPVLQALGPVIRGLSSVTGPAARALLLEVLMPLHRTNDWLVWDRQTPLVALYHTDLMYCVEAFILKDPRLATKLLHDFVKYFPPLSQSNTPKEALLCHQASRMLHAVDRASVGQALPSLISIMSRQLASHNSQAIQSALVFWKDPHIASLFSLCGESLVPALLPLLLREGEPSWNPTVNRMTGLVLEKLEASSPSAFARLAEDLWGADRPTPRFLDYQPAEAAEEAEKAEEANEAEEAEGDEKSPGGSALHRRPPGGPSIASLKFGLAGWRPSGSGGAADCGGSQPTQPPLTATGVAPWSFGPQKMKPGPLAAKIPAKEAKTKQLLEAKGMNLATMSGLDRVHAYMELINPAQGDAESKPWEAALAAETPTLMPAVKFHQLVFSASEIGRGSFAVVWHAHFILKEKPRSEWPECAVKVINTQTMQDLGYENCVNREICVLRMLSHPGIARMLASFRWRDGAYLVLEYAAKGDLYSIMLQHGKLEVETTRFFIGEIVAALCAIHEVGFVYVDLKPENVVVTASGHAKLTDFGGCRPLTAWAKERTKQSLVRRLRDGDWRAPDSVEEAATEEENIAEVAVDDDRVEGTLCYSSPDVLSGAVPNLSTDAWALGCVLYQLLVGRPPIWEEDEEDLRLKIINFEPDDIASSLRPLPQDAQDLVRKLLQAEPKERLAVSSCHADPFFADMDVFSLYKKPRGPSVRTGRAAAAEGVSGDARWQKRQYSKIWTVMPSAEDYSLPPSHKEQSSDLILETDAERGKPFGSEMPRRALE